MGEAEAVRVLEGADERIVSTGEVAADVEEKGGDADTVVPDEAEAVDAVCHASSGCEGTSVGGLPHPGRIPLQRTTSANATRELRLRIASPRFQLIFAYFI